MAETRSISNISHLRIAAALAGMLLLPLLRPAVVVTAAEPVQFQRDVRPILSRHCFPCHGPDESSRKANLRLDDREGALAPAKSGGTAIVPGQPGQSELIRRINAAEPEQVMPPPAAKNPLKDEQKKILERWIADGAQYQPHWAFIPPQRPALPAVKNTAWVRNPIDQFILAKLEANGLTPAAEADRRMLARRLSLDLTGLPPEPAEVEAFVNDQSPDAYEKLVDRWLASPRWGEHRAHYWLDAARYADTHGIHFDNYREMWSYRDWVIDAFNRNLPYNQFTIEQLAGDLLKDATQDQKIATGFNRCNPTTNEGGVIPEEYLVLYTRDRTETTARVWLGLTANCAVCHDHKFDPLTQKEFYRMAAFFNNTTQGAMDGNIKDTPPVIKVTRTEDRERAQAIEKEIAAIQQQLKARSQAARPEFDKWIATATPATFKTTSAEDDAYFYARLNEGQGKTTRIRIDDKDHDVQLAASTAWQPGPMGDAALQTEGAAFELADVGDFDKNQPFACSAWIKVTPNNVSGAICARMDNINKYRGWDFWVQGRRVGSHVINTWPENALKVVAKPQIPADQWVHVSVTYDGSGKAAGVKVYYDGKPQPTEVENDKLSATTRTTVPFKLGQRHASEPLSGLQIQDLRIYKRVLAAAEIEGQAKAARFAAIFAKPADKRAEGEKTEVFEWWLGTQDKPYEELAQKIGPLEQEQNGLSGRGTVAHIMQEKPDKPKAYVLFRGEYDKRRDEVEPGTPEILPPMPVELPRSRLGFAEWLLLPGQPVTTRVTVNRFWQEVFGVGIVATTEDFGINGDLPSHPLLLDWLAIEFRESGWDVKKLFRLMVTSTTYRQAAVASPEKLEKDPQNRLLSRGPRFRMDAEMIRDYALAASGLLSAKIGGPSVKPYQPDGVWEAVAMRESNTSRYQRDSGENLYRRSLYTFWKRAAPPASMDIFNAPTREVCMVRRERTNTPLQALVTLNDPQFIEAARNLAQSALKDGARLDRMAQRLLARPLAADEAKVVQATLDDLLKYYQEHPDDAGKLIAVGESKPDPAVEPPQLAAWTMVANQLMNLDEVLNK